MVKKVKKVIDLIVNIILDCLKKDRAQPIYYYYKYTRRCSVKEVP